MDKNHSDDQSRHEDNLEKNKIIGSIGHEFNNLLMGIQGNISLIYLDIDQKDLIYKRLKDIETYIKGGVKLTEKLLDFVSDGIYQTAPEPRHIDNDNAKRIKNELQSVKKTGTGEYPPLYDLKVRQGLQTYNAVFTGVKTILLADDEEIIIDVGRQMLERMGLETIIARNGQETVDKYRKDYKKISMVILDMIMPDFDGIETYRQLKEINPGVKVLFSSGYRKTEHLDNIIRSGHNGFIQKPFNMNFLKQEIGKIIGTL